MVIAMARETSADAMYAEMKARLERVVPDVELRQKAVLACEINRLKRERNAVILGHNYMEPALFHSIPDYTGDSLELSRTAAETDGGPHRLLRRAVHGGDGEDPQPDEDGPAAGARGPAARSRPASPPPTSGR